MFSITEGHLEMVKFLVSQGAIQKNSENVLELAQAYGHLSIVKILLSQGMDESCLKIIPSLDVLSWIDIFSNENLAPKVVGIHKSTINDEIIKILDHLHKIKY